MLKLLMQHVLPPKYAWGLFSLQWKPKHKQIMGLGGKNEEVSSKVLNPPAMGQLACSSMPGPWGAKEFVWAAIGMEGVMGCFVACQETISDRCKE